MRYNNLEKNNRETQFLVLWGGGKVKPDTFLSL